MISHYHNRMLDDLETWLGKQLTHISGKSPLAGAIRYALTRIPKLRPYLTHGFLELDNNTVERAMRPITIGITKSGMKYLTDDKFLEGLIDVSRRMTPETFGAVIGGALANETLKKDE